MLLLSPTTPVLVGAAQFTERLDDPDYEALSPVDITARAAQLAFKDCGNEGIVRSLTR